MPKPDTREYLGDSVYVGEGNYAGEIVLMTDNGSGPQNEIYLGPPEIRAFVGYLALHEAKKLSAEQSQGTFVVAKKPERTQGSIAAEDGAGAEDYRGHGEYSR